MSKQTTNLSKEALTFLKVNQKGKPQIIKAAPVQEPLDEFDNFDEMFLQLNNSLIEKHDELKEKAAELDKKETELEIKERDLDNQEADLINERKKQKEYHIQLVEKEQQLFKLQAQLDKEKKATARYNKELTDKNAKLDQYAIETKDSVPLVFYSIPPASEKSNSYPMFKALNDLGSSAIYTQARQAMIKIDKRLRQLFLQSLGNDKNILTISGAYYQSMFICETYEDISRTLMDYLNSLSELNDDELNKTLQEMRDKVLEPVSKLAMG